MYFAFGSTDAFAIADLPDNAAAAALALTVSGAGGATVDTVVLLAPEEIDTATQAGCNTPHPARDHVAPRGRPFDRRSTVIGER